MIPDLEPLIEFERTEIDYHHSAPEPAAGIRVRVGNLPVVFSAPHGCKHRRAGRWKQEDEYTSTIVEYLHRLTNAHAIYTTHRIDPDPHDDGNNNVYKRTLAKLVDENEVLLVVDIHGAREKNDFGVSLGTMRGVTCPEYQSLIIDHFENAGYYISETAQEMDRLVVDHPKYTGGLTMPTITRFVYEELHIPSVQVELNARVRLLQRLKHSTNARRKKDPNYRCDHERFRRMMTAFVTLAEHLGTIQR